MKRTLINFIISILITFIPTIIFILTVTLLSYNQIINNNNLSIITAIGSIIAFFILSFIFSLKQKNHGLLHGIVLSLIYIVILVIFHQYNSNLYIQVARIGALLLGSIIGVNLTHQED